MAKDKQSFSSNKIFHVLEAQQFSREWLEKVFFPESKKMEQMLQRKKTSEVLKDKSICLLFYEPSTRTRNSFEQAAKKLGTTTVTSENAKDFSSAIKGETIQDTARVVNALHFDAMVIRSDYAGASAEAAQVSEIPVINAGDGTGQHPTQALLDIDTIYSRFGKLDNLKIALVGDLLNGRTVRSLAYLISKFKGVHIEMVAPKQFQMKQDILDHLKEHKISFHQTEKLLDVVDKVDVVYMTRLQTERLGKNERVKGDNVRITKEVLAKMGKKTVIMHPLPRSAAFNEIPEEFTSDPRVIIFDQVSHGLYSRMALLKLILAP